MQLHTCRQARELDPLIGQPLSGHRAVNGGSVRLEPEGAVERCPPCRNRRRPFKCRIAQLHVRFDLLDGAGRREIECSTSGSGERELAGKAPGHRAQRTLRGNV